MPKQYQYFFRRVAEKEIHVTKVEANDVDQPIVYIVKQVQGEWRYCDCPASFRYAERGPCKHCQWVKRWLAILGKRPELKNTPLFYDPKKDAFYPVRSLDGSALDKLMEGN